MSKILVTGGMGFIGAHLCERLVTDNEVVIVDDMSANPLKVDELYHKSRVIEWSVTNAVDFVGTPIYFAKNELFDAIYHLASPVGPAGILPHSGNIIRRIVDDTYAVIKLAQMNNCRLVYVSTSEIYGGGTDGLCAETTPRNISAETTVRLEYAIGKLAGETAVLNTPDLDAVIIRPFNVCGTRQRSKGGFVVPRFVEQALSGQPLTVFGDGDQVRAFTHVDDIVDGLLLAMDKGGAKQAYNLGNPSNRTTVLELALVVKRLVADVPIVFTNGKAVYGTRYAEAADKYPDASKAIRELGWMPHRTIDQTISEVAAYMREHAEAV